MGRTGKVGKIVVGTAVALIAGLSMAAEHPDFTGVWTNATAPPGAAAATRDSPPSPLLKPEAKARIDAYKKLVAKSGDTPGGWCLGTGMPGSMLGSGGYPMEIIQRPEQITVIYEAHSETRRIYFGSRNAVEKDRVPGRNGYSSGHWEGDTLVVETDSLIDQIDQRTTSHSDQATIVERYSLDGKDAQGRRILKAEMTMTDPGFYTGPVKQTKRWAEVPNGRLLPYECPEEMWTDRLEKLAKEANVPLP
ncbi:MAG: hypothetical protein ABI645_09885 [Pseudomonadota bacterium]